MDQIKEIEAEIAALRAQLKNHRLYQTLNSVNDIQTFMESHIFAVWDFMSLLKFLQGKLTVIESPWIPSKNAKITRFVNELVFAEESDLNEVGQAKSHFEMYLDAMTQIGANQQEITDFLQLIESGHSVSYALNQINIDQEVAEFVQFTFNLIATEKPHLVAAAFTFGREEIIPDLFLGILNAADAKNVKYTKLRYYLERHIELDGDEHGPLSLEMIKSLCSSNAQKWLEVKEVATQALKQRIKLWDSIADELVHKQNHMTSKLSL